MPVVRYQEYEIDKREFFAKHHNDFKCETKGSSAEYYRHNYIFADGAEWYEVMLKVTEEVECEVNFVKFKTTIDLLQTEYYNSDSSGSKFYYEKWDHTRR